MSRPFRLPPLAPQATALRDDSAAGCGGKQNATSLPALESWRGLLPSKGVKRDLPVLPSLGAPVGE